MTDKNWYETGDQIRNIVQNAIENGDFSQLSTTITNVINEAADTIGDTLRESAKGRAETSRDAVNRQRNEAAERIRRNTMRDTEKKDASGDTEPRHIRPSVSTALTTPGLTSGRVMKWTGYSLGGILGGTSLLLAAAGLAAEVNLIAPAGILAVMAAGAISFGIRGNIQTNFSKRFRRYAEVIGERTFCKIEELAAAIGEDSRFVRKDLKKMIKKGYFRQGYLDKKETCLITDQSTYQQYLETQEAYEMRSEEKSRNSDANQAERRKASREYQMILEEGKEYIEHIHLCNDRIHDKEISDKLDRMETVVTRIFIQAAKKPESSGDLKKLMSYYLPTTKKLLDAYCELDEQPFSGQNIETTKREIKDVLDTLNTAFENMLDDLFEDKAWDISSDISVLNTMLAQEGLTQKDFETE